MEFVALGVLGLFAMTTNNNNKQNRKPATPAVVTAPKPTFKQTDAEFRKDVARHFDNPAVVIPYFRSEKSQNTSDAVKDRRLETFTGVNNIDYKPKTETVAPTPVKDLTNIHGVTFQPDMARYQHYIASGKNHNVSPVEKQYVGPGVGIDPSKPAEGGFHQFFRVMPDNVNGYRKNNFGGAVVHGHHAHQRESDAFQATRVVENVKLTESEQAQLGARGLDARHAASTGSASTVRSAQVLGFKHEQEASCNNGVMYSNNGTYLYGQGTRTDDRSESAGLNAGFANLNGGYQNARFLQADTDRETLNTQQQTNRTGAGQFGTYTDFSAAAPTMRGQQGLQTERQIGSAAPLARSGFDEARPTHKQSYSQTNYVGNAGSSAGHTLTDTQLYRTTQRSTAAAAGELLHGPAGAYISGATSYDINAQNYDRVYVADHIPNSQQTTNARVYGDVTQSGFDNNHARVCSNPQGKGTQVFPSTQQLGVTQFNNPDPDMNRRDFGYTPPNPLRTPSWSTNKSSTGSCSR